jgi:hypothetical protein
VLFRSRVRVDPGGGGFARVTTSHTVTGYHWDCTMARAAGGALTATCRMNGGWVV